MSGMVRLEKLIEKSHIKYRDFDSDQELVALGVSNTDGITRTTHRKSDDLGEYLVIEPGSFAYNPYRINVGSIGLTPANVTGVVPRHWAYGLFVAFWPQDVYYESGAACASNRRLIARRSGPGWSPVPADHPGLH